MALTTLFRAATTLGRLRALLLASVVASLLWGAVATWSAEERLSAANSVVASSGPLSYDAQQVYQSLSDADATEANSYLSSIEPSGIEPGPDTTRVHEDISRAEADILLIRAGDSDPAIQADLSALATGIPNYTNYVGEADAFNREQQLVGAAWLGDASSLTRRTLLPAASDLYGKENARLEAASAQAAGFPLVAVVIAVLAGVAALLAQWWLARRTRRVLNPGLVAAFVVGVLSLAWLLTSVAVARSDLLGARDQGSAPTQALVQAQITALTMHADESLTLINRGGSSDPSQLDYAKLWPRLRAQIITAQSVGRGSPGYPQAVAAAKAVQAWQDEHGNLIGDVAGDYAAAVNVATGPSASDFQAMENALITAIGADHARFTSSSASGDDALGGLVAGMIVAGLLMTAAGAWGVSRRVGEYR